MKTELEILSIIGVSFFTIPLYKALRLPNNCILHFVCWILPQYFVIMYPVSFLYIAALSCTLQLFLHVACTRASDNIENANRPVHKANKTFYPIFHINRAVLILLVMICIFACDFAIFPVQHHKSDFYRNTLMDVGIGAFLFNNGCFYKKNTKANVIRVLFLFALGFVRLLTLRLLNYPYNLSEYGRDFNFYFVLGFVYLLFPLIDTKHNFKVAFVLSIFWEYMLRVYEYDLWLFSEYRKTWLNMNKEGICAILPSLIIFMYANCLGKIAFCKAKINIDKQEKTKNKQNMLQKCMYIVNTALSSKIVQESDKLVHLCKYSAMFLYILHTSCKMSMSSRRLGNMCYTSWILFLHTFLISLTFVANTYVNTEVFAIAEFLSKHMLFYFLYSNVLVLLFSFCSKNYSTAICHAINVAYLALLVLVPFGVAKTYKRVKQM